MVEQQVKSDAFRIEYQPNISEKILLDDVVSYLGEYRFGLQKYSYDLTFKEGKLRDLHRNEPMTDLAQRAIDRKFRESRLSLREQTEKEGFLNLDQQLSSAQDGNTVVWASPPGPKEEGFGDYGFIFIGKVKEKNSAEKQLKMTAIRVEKPTLSQFNQAWRLLTGETTDRKTPEEFLRNPQIIREDLQEGYIDALLGMSFNFQPKKEEQGEFMKIIREMDPLLKDFVYLVRSGSSQEKIKALNVLENYALKLKQDDETKNIIYVRPRDDLRIKDIVGEFGHKPPAAAGSCGSTTRNEFTSSNILTRGSLLNSLSENQEWFTCPKCSYKADGPIGNTCPGCGLTKEEYVQETGDVCD